MQLRSFHPLSPLLMRTAIKLRPRKEIMEDMITLPRIRSTCGARHRELAGRIRKRFRKLARPWWARVKESAR